MKKIFFIGLGFMVATFSGCDLRSSEIINRLTTATTTKQPSESSKVQQGPLSGDTLREPEGVVIVKIKNSVFVPDAIRIKINTQVRWINEDDIEHRIASNPCPMHSDLPAMTSLPLKKGDAHNFTFIATGTVGYHDHLNPDIQGKVIVE